VQTASRKVVVPRQEIDEIQPSKVSLMPTELLKPFDEHEVRSLVAYLSGAGQVPMLARPETAVFITAYGDDLTGWRRAHGEWKVEHGEIVAVGADVGEPPILISDLLLADDFVLVLRVHVGKDGRGAVILRGEDAEKAGMRVEWAAGEGVVLVGGDSKRVGEGPDSRNPARVDAWNDLEVRVHGQRVEVRLNGLAVGQLADTQLPARRMIAFEGPRGGGRMARFAQLDLQLQSRDKAQ
jgi:hypothetical protein